MRSRAAPIIEPKTAPRTLTGNLLATLSDDAVEVADAAELVGLVSVVPVGVTDGAIICCDEDFTSIAVALTHEFSFAWNMQSGSFSLPPEITTCPDPPMATE